MPQFKLAKSNQNNTQNITMSFNNNNKASDEVDERHQTNEDEDKDKKKNATKQKLKHDSTQSISPPSLKRQKTDSSTSNSNSHRNHQRNNNAANAAVSATTHPCVLLEPGDNAIITHSIMDRVRLKVQIMCNNNNKNNKNQAAAAALTCIEQERKGDTTSTHHHHQHYYQSTVQHIQQTDQWSCGIRNLQMMLSAMLPHLSSSHTIFQQQQQQQRHDDDVPLRKQPVPVIPNLRHIQQTLERAWHDDNDKDDHDDHDRSCRCWDVRGAQHYQYKIVGKTGRAAYVGAMEVATILWYWGVDATVVQFIQCHESRKLLPKFVQAYFGKGVTGIQGCSFCQQQRQQEAVAVAVGSKYCVHGLLQHAAAAAAANDVGLLLQLLPAECTCPILPLYLQWEGHSVTIVGITDDGNNLLVLDPMKSAITLQQELATAPFLEPLQLPIHRLQNKDTQIILCTLSPLSNAARNHIRECGGSVVTAAEAAVQLHKTLET
jgi:Peptidase family C78